MQMNVTEATQIARKYFNEVYSGESVKEVMLEEVTSDEANWYITFGFRAPTMPTVPTNSLSQFLPPPAAQPVDPAMLRVYKKVTVDDASRTAKELAMRLIG